MSGDDVDVGRILEDLARTEEESRRLAKIVANPKVLADFVEQEQKRDQTEKKERERKRFATAVRDGYDSWDGDLYHPAYVCRRCGALVPERERHQRWHDGQDEINQKADSAYWHDQPIG